MADKTKLMKHTYIHTDIYTYGSVQSIMFTIVGNRHDKLNSNLGRGCLHFT